MRSVSFYRLLAGTAGGVAMVLAAGATTASAQSVVPAEVSAPLPARPPASKSDDAKAIDALIPMPAIPDLPPPTAKDFTPLRLPETTGQAAQAQPNRPSKAAEAKDLNSRIPMPDIPNLPPPTAKDFTPLHLPGNAEEEAASTVPSIDTKVAEALHGLAAGRFDRIIGNRKERASIEAFYKARDYAPLWISDGAVNARGKAAITYLAGVAADGLNPADYPRPDFASANREPKRLAEDEIRLTESVVTYAHQAEMGRVSYTRISADISYHREGPTPEEVLAKLAKSDATAKTLDSFNPPQPGFKALKAKLAELRAGKIDGRSQVVEIAAGPILRPGMSDPRVISLRKRLKIAANPDSPVYDDDVVSAVKAFQRDHDLSVDGLLGPNTRLAMNGRHRPTADPIDTVIANMERWRWMPRQLGNPYVMVNIPAYTLRVVEDGKTLWKTKIVVGKPSKHTPLINAEMKYITVNPTWNVPPSIIRNEYLPVIEQDPGALARTGLKMDRNPDGTIRIWQPPGPANALGRIRFNFPNKFLVYQHDTPDKYLFARYPRAYSHGCMRVQDPIKYAQVLLSLVLPRDHYTQARIRSMFGTQEINISFPKYIPVHITYQTAFVDDDGKLQFRNDVYGYDAATLKWLKGDREERRVADIPIERPPSSSSKPVMMPPGLMARVDGDDGYYSGPGNFFERLFGLGDDEPPRGGRRSYYYRN